MSWWTNEEKSHRKINRTAPPINDKNTHTYDMHTGQTVKKKTTNATTNRKEQFAYVNARETSDK